MKKKLLWNQAKYTYFRIGIIKEMWWWISIQTFMADEGIWKRENAFLTRSLREPGGPCTKPMEVSESRMERVNSTVFHFDRWPQCKHLEGTCISCFWDNLGLVIWWMPQEAVNICMISEFSLPAICNLAKRWRLSCKPCMRSVCAALTVYPDLVD